MIIGIGGGKTLDTLKAVGYTLGVPAIIMLTNHLDIRYQIELLELVRGLGSVRSCDFRAWI